MRQVSRKVQLLFIWTPAPSLLSSVYCVLGLGRENGFLLEVIPIIELNGAGDLGFVLQKHVIILGCAFGCQKCSVLDYTVCVKLHIVQENKK